MDEEFDGAGQKQRDSIRALLSNRKRKRPRDAASSGGFIRLGDAALGGSASARKAGPGFQGSFLHGARRLANPLLQLHEEILDFCTLVSPTEAERQARRELIDEIGEVVHAVFGDHVELALFGSTATGLYLPSSDVDVVIVGVKPEGGRSLRMLAKELMERNLVTYIEVVDKARVPIVKFKHKRTDISVDVSFDVGSGPTAVRRIRRYLRRSPAFRPLTLVLKYFLAQRKLNETFSGGVGSFLLQMMIVSFLQHRHRQMAVDDAMMQASSQGTGAAPVSSASQSNLGSLLLDFFQLYGRDFNFVNVGISVRNKGSYYNKVGGQQKAKNAFPANSAVLTVWSRSVLHWLPVIYASPDTHSCVVVPPVPV